MPDAEVDTSLLATATGTDQGNGLIDLDPVPGLLEQTLVVAVQGHITIAVIDYQQQAEPSEPIGEGHPAMMNGADLPTLGR